MDKFLDALANWIIRAYAAALVVIWVAFVVGLIILIPQMAAIGAVLVVGFWAANRLDERGINPW